MPILSGGARLAGVIGWPVSHSRSPLLHGTWLARHGIDGAYVPLPVRPADFPAVVRALAAAGFAGVNVTVPHKQAAFDLCDTLDTAARRTGAVNTLVFRDGAIAGRNTDGAGFVDSLLAAGLPYDADVLLLGAGGAARAIAVALLDAGARVTVSNRSPGRAEALAEALGVSVAAWDDRDAALADHGLLVNTTVLGMAGQPALPMSLARAAAGLIVADIVYVPLETPLLAEARARGLRTLDGLGMLLHQARAGFEAWFGVRPEVDQALRDIVVADLAR